MNKYITYHIDGQKQGILFKVGSQTQYITVTSNIKSRGFLFICKRKKNTISFLLNLS